MAPAAVARTVSRTHYSTAAREGFAQVGYALYGTRVVTLIFMIVIMIVIITHARSDESECQSQCV